MKTTCIAVLIALVAAVHSTSAVKGNEPVRVRIPKCSVFSNMKAFDFQMPILALLPSYSLTFRMKVRSWEDGVSVVGEPEHMELFTATTVPSGTTPATTAAAGSEGHVLRAWVEDVGAMAEMAISYDVDHDISLAVVQGESVALCVDGTCSVAHRPANRLPPAKKAAIPAATNVKDLSLRLGGGKGDKRLAASNARDGNSGSHGDGGDGFMANLWQIKVWRGVLDKERTQRVFDNNTSGDKAGPTEEIANDEMDVIVASAFPDVRQVPVSL